MFIGCTLMFIKPVLWVMQIALQVMSLRIHWGARKVRSIRGESSEDDEP